MKNFLKNKFDWLLGKKHSTPEFDISKIDISEIKNCSSFDDNFENWDTSKYTKLVSLKDMSLEQVKFCFKYKLVDEYPLIGFAAIINSEILEYFDSLKLEENKKINMSLDELNKQIINDMSKRT